jgi:hypothetical protein
LPSHLLSAERLKYENYNFVFVSYVCETRSLALTDEHRYKVIDNTVLTRISGPKWDIVCEGSRKLHNKELHNL